MRVLLVTVIIAGAYPMYAIGSCRQIGHRLSGIPACNCSIEMAKSFNGRFPIERGG